MLLLYVHFAQIIFELALFIVFSFIIHTLLHIKLIPTFCSLLKLRAAKVQSAPSVAPPSLSNKTVAPASEWQHTPLQNNQQSAATPALEQSSSTQAENDLTSDMGEDVSAADDRGQLCPLFVIVTTFPLNPKSEEHQKVLYMIADDCLYLAIILKKFSEYNCRFSI